MRVAGVRLDRRSAREDLAAHPPRPPGLRRQGDSQESLRVPRTAPTRPRPRRNLRDSPGATALGATGAARIGGQRAGGDETLQFAPGTVRVTLPTATCPLANVRLPTWRMNVSLRPGPSTMSITAPEGSVQSAHRLREHSLTLTQTTDRYLGHRMSCAGPLGLRLHRVPNLVAAGGAQEYNSSTIAASRERRVDFTTPAARRAGRKHLRHTKAVEDMCTTTVRRQLVPESTPVKRTSEDNHDQKCHCRRPTQAEPNRKRNTATTRVESIRGIERAHAPRCPLLRMTPMPSRLRPSRRLGAATALQVHARNSGHRATSTPL